MSDERRQQIVDAARQLYEEQGLSATTVKDISERCGVARSLFYHYFRNKQEVTSAVIDDFVNDYIESLQFWNEHRTPGDIEGSLAGVVTVMRVGVFEHTNHAGGGHAATGVGARRMSTSTPKSPSSSRV